MHSFIVSPSFFFSYPSGSQLSVAGTGRLVGYCLLSRCPLRLPDFRSAVEINACCFSEKSLPLLRWPDWSGDILSVYALPSKFRAIIWWSMSGAHCPLFNSEIQVWGQASLNRKPTSSTSTVPPIANLRHVCRTPRNCK